MPSAVITNAKESPTRELKRVLLVPFGNWKGHHSGEQTYGPAECAAMVAYFNATAGANGKAVVIDYGHQSLEGYEAPAAGWIWSVELDEQADPPGIYGMVEWTERAAAAIKGNEYRYISPVIVEGMPDPVTGEPVPMQLFNAALTNIPFMADKMNAVSASMEAAGRKLYLNSITLSTHAIHTNQGGPTVDPQKMMDDAKAALGLDASATPDDVLAFIKKLVEFLSLVPGAPAGGTPPAPGDMPSMTEAMQQTVANAKTLADVAKILDCEPKDAVAKATALSNTAAVTPDVATLTARIAELERAAAEAKADEHIRANESRIQPVHRPMYREMLVKDFENTAKIIATLPELKPAPAPAPASAKKANDTDIPDDVRKHYRDALGTHTLHNTKEA